MAHGIGEFHDVVEGIGLCLWLSAALGRDVITIASDAKAARADPGKELARFSPVLDAVTRADTAAPILIDIGAGEVGQLR